MNRKELLVNVGCALVITVLSPWHASAAMTEGSKPKEWPADPTFHKVEIERVVKNEGDAKWITAAENLLPDATALLEAATKEEANAVVAEKQWWYQNALGVKIPFALTGDAISYYTSLVNGYGKQAMNRFMQPNSKFTFTAKVEKNADFACDGKKFQNVMVVTLRMTFEENFAASTTEGMSFSKQRIVVFDFEQKVLHVSGDGETEAMILAI